MQYLALIYFDEKVVPDRSSEEQQEIYQDYMRVTAEMKERGVFVAGDALKGVATATTVRVREGERLVTDGPFAETKEQLGGYYLMDCKDLDEALELAAKIPAARHGCVEVRPIMAH